VSPKEKKFLLHEFKAEVKAEEAAIPTTWEKAYKSAYLDGLKTAQAILKEVMEGIEED
jgi:hypothetical protein